MLLAMKLGTRRTAARARPLCLPRPQPRPPPSLPSPFSDRPYTYIRPPTPPVGTQIARFDFSFGDPSFHQQSYDNLKVAMKTTGKLCATMLVRGLKGGEADGRRGERARVLVASSSSSR